jgi:hypothetical protein
MDKGGKNRARRRKARKFLVIELSFMFPPEKSGPAKLKDRRIIPI